MKIAVTIALVASSIVGVANAQVGAWGQCGGNNYAGSTACYSQCIPGSGNTPSSNPTTAPKTTQPTTKPTAAPSSVPTVTPTQKPTPSTSKPQVSTPAPSQSTSKPTPVPVTPSSAPPANGQLTFKATVDGITLNGSPFLFKGANYFGLETDISVPHGLWGGGQSTTIAKIAAFLKNN
ncbi:hypothetical protein LEN26_001193 [Aphanomyces euteiches]|nr:hypothetical protein LEN26_001193 [Aphanomyces euteiches]